MLVVDRAPIALETVLKLLSQNAGYYVIAALTPEIAVDAVNLPDGFCFLDRTV